MWYNLVPIQPYHKEQTMAELSFNQTLMEECKKRQEEKEHKELIKSLKPLVSSQPAFNYTNIKTVKDSIKHG